MQQVAKKEESKGSKQQAASSSSASQMMQKKFELENEVIEEELFQFSEAETDRLFKERPWNKE
jgi:hypothetical protein